MKGSIGEMIPPNAAPDCRDRVTQRLKTTSSGNFTPYQFPEQNFDITQIFLTLEEFAVSRIGQKRVDAPLRLDLYSRGTLRLPAA